MDSDERISLLVERAKDTARRIAETETYLKARQEDYREVTERQIPALMAELGLADVTLTDGTKVAVSEDIKASITQEKQDAAFLWLQENGHGGMIKTVTKTSVHPQSLMALMRELLERGDNVPLETFSIFRYTKTKIN
jgi:phosphoenolpyruvate-protein kinase (PTS system EI component)